MVKIPPSSSLFHGQFTEWLWIKCDTVQHIVCGETHGEDSPPPSLFQGQFTEWLWIKCDIVQQIVCGETHGEDSPILLLIPWAIHWMVMNKMRYRSTYCMWWNTWWRFPNPLLIPRTIHGMVMNKMRYLWTYCMWWNTWWRFPHPSLFHGQFTEWLWIKCDIVQHIVCGETHGEDSPPSLFQGQFTEWLWIKCDIVQHIVCGETHGEDSPTPSLFHGQFTEWLWIKCDIVQHNVCGETHGEDSPPLLIPRTIHWMVMNKMRYRSTYCMWWNTWWRFPTPSLFIGQFTEWLWIKCDIVQHFVCGETHGEDSHPPPYSKDKSLNG